MTEMHPEPGTEPGHHEASAAPQDGAEGRSAGRRVAKLLGLLVLALVVLYALFFHIFPWVERNVSNPSLDAARVELTSLS